MSPSSGARGGGGDSIAGPGSGTATAGSSGCGGRDSARGLLCSGRRAAGSVGAKGVLRGGLKGVRVVAAVCPGGEDDPGGGGGGGMPTDFLVAPKGERGGDASEDRPAIGAGVGVGVEWGCDRTGANTGAAGGGTNIGRAALCRGARSRSCDWVGGGRRGGVSCRPDNGLVAGLGGDSSRSVGGGGGGVTRLGL